MNMLINHFLHLTHGFFGYEPSVTQKWKNEVTGNESISQYTILWNNNNQLILI